MKTFRVFYTRFFNNLKYLIMRKVYLLCFVLFMPLSVVFSQCPFFVGVQDISCNGNNDGVIEIYMIDGEGPFTFSVNGVLYESQDSFLVVSNLAEGIYEIEITDANNCEVNSTAIINAPTPIVISNSTTIVNCGEEVCINLLVTGGSPPYSVTWPNGQGSGTLICDFFSPGTYSVMVTDNNGCTANSEFIVDQGPPLEGVIVEDEIDCATANLTANITGGTAPYLFQWNDE